jgi:hypothetical protein
MELNPDERLVWPIHAEPSLFEECLVKHCPTTFRGFCNVCGQVTEFRVLHDNLRETCSCENCGSFNRQRQISSVILHGMHNSRGLHALKDLLVYKDLTIYNTECRNAIHNVLRKHPGYLCSEFFGPSYESGSLVKGVMHQDLMTLSLKTESVDLIISSDVFEHIPDPYKAHEQVWRVLKQGGRHVFTVPFNAGGFLDEVRASCDETGTVHYHKEPVFHGDPLRPEGALVFRIFSLEMLVKLAKIGFRTNMWRLRDHSLGICGPNGIVFEAVKAP